jgi:low affinity Fe/Cu permease
VTFLMVFLIQNAQNRDGAAIQVKLNELIRVSQAQNSFVGVEHLTEEELADIRASCEARAKAADERRRGNKMANGNHVSPARNAEPKAGAH